MAGRIDNPVIGLFVTCLVDLFRPSVAFATIRLLEQSGCDVHVPKAQTCCGQPGYNSGDKKTAQKIAKAVISAFEPYDYVVVPSGSCTGMIRHHYSLLLANEPDWRGRAEKLAGKTYELTEFLIDVLKVKTDHRPSNKKIAFHDSCAALRELGVHVQPRQLLSGMRDIENGDRCCGFGGAFSVKYGDISGHMTDNKAAAITKTGADMVTSCDLGCLMNISAGLSRSGSKIKVRHIAEILAEGYDDPQ